MFPIEITDIFFYIVSALIIITAIFTVTAKNVLQSVIFLIFSFIGTAVFYLMLHAEFIAISQVMVYAGGVVIFVIFTILLTSRLGETNLSIKIPRTFISAIISLSLVFIMLRFLLQDSSLITSVPEAQNNYASLESMALRLLSVQSDGFVIAFELISLLLLVTLICSITIARKSKDNK